MARSFQARNGAIVVRVNEQTIELLRSLLGQLRELLLVDEAEEIRRLYPTAYPDDAELEASYREMVHDQLLMSRLDGIEIMEETLENDVLTPAEADVWMSTINQIRLVLGTRLDVSEDDPFGEGLPEVGDERSGAGPGHAIEDDPEVVSRLIYDLLSQMLGRLTLARSALL